MQTFRLDSPNFLDPRWLGRLGGRQIQATVQPGGRVHVEGAELAFQGEVPPGGTSVLVWIDSCGYLVAALAADVQRERIAALAAAAAEQDADRDRRNRARVDALAFTRRIQLPVAWGVAIKRTLSGVSQSSWGDGRYRSTVLHILLQAPLQHGRLQRRAGDLLCSCSPTRNGRTGASVEAHHDGEGNAYTPAVTCATCLAVLEKHGWIAVDPGPPELDN